jgi:hypothetical protein
MKQHLNLINGEWVGASFAENRNPSDLTAPVGLYARATVEDTRRHCRRPRRPACLVRDAAAFPPCDSAPGR